MREPTGESEEEERVFHMKSLFTSEKPKRRRNAAVVFLSVDRVPYYQFLSGENMAVPLLMRLQEKGP